MAFRCRNLRRISAIFSGIRFHECARVNNSSASSLLPLAYALEDIVRGGAFRILHSSRFSTVAAGSKEVSGELDLLSYIRSTFDLTEGPYHCWINRRDDRNEFLQKEGVYLLLADGFLDDPPGFWGDQIIMLEKVKLLQQRYPWLQVFGFQSCSSVTSMAHHSLLVDAIMEEYIRFPILLCSKTFPEVANGACCILFEGLKSPPLYIQNDVDLSILQKAIKDLSKRPVQNHGIAEMLKSSWSKEIEGFKEPYIYSYLKNLPLFLPACISTDEHGKRFFLSDSNHHRVIVCDSTGKILDAIGSSPGYDDGDFEIAKLMRPAASWYHASEDCLYLVDSENHAIRRANLGERVLETIYPSCTEKKDRGLWSRVLDELGFRREGDLESAEFDQASLLFPWHLLISKDNDLLVLNKSFETLWIMDLESGRVLDVVKGHGSIMEFCGQQIMEKVSALQGLSSDVLQQLINSGRSLGGSQSSHLGFVSSFVTSGEDRLICDTVGQRVLMLNEKAEVASSVDLSNFETLGMPYWLTISLESVFSCGNICQEAIFDHLQSFTPLPGKIDVYMAIDIPDNTELVEPLQEQCVWRQARGAAMVEVLEMETSASIFDTVGIAQKWYDDLDNLAFEMETDVSKEDNRSPRRYPQDGKVHIDCVVKTSPGTSEVIISAPLYLKLRSNCKTVEDSQEARAAEIADILKVERDGRLKRDMLIQLLLKLKRDLRDLVFIKPLHVKIAFNTLNHPKAVNSRDIILTDTIVDVNISL